MKQKRGREDPCDICGHYHDYEGGEPCSICGHRLAAGAVAAPPALPGELLPGLLLVGSYDHASRAELLKALGVDAVLCLVPSCPALFRSSFEYHTVASAPPPLDECVAFIERVRARGGRVLIHCMTGASRAPAVAAAYLMRARGARLDAAYAALAAAVPALALSAADAARLEAEEAAALGPAASGFRVPVGRQPPPPAPFGWAGAAPPAGAPAPLGGGGAPAAPGFVFDAQ